MGLWLNMAVFEVFECVEPLRMTRVQTLLLKFDESWVTLSISVQGAPIIGRPNIRTSSHMLGSSQPLVLREDFTQINCVQSVKVKIWCCKEICQVYATRDIC